MYLVIKWYVINFRQVIAIHIFAIYLAHIKRQKNTSQSLHQVNFAESKLLAVTDKLRLQQNAIMKKIYSRETF